MKRILLAVFSLFLLILHASNAPESPVVLLFDKEEVTVNADGTSRTTDECIYHILNYEGLRQMRSLSLHFNSDYGTIEVTHLAIVKPDGRKIQLDPAALSSISVEDSQMASSIYDPANKILTIQVPGLETGDKLEVTTLEVTTKSRMPGQWSDIAVLQANFPIEYYEYTVKLPAGKPLLGICIKDEVPGSITHTKTEKDGFITYTWIARNVPQVIPESAMPSLYTCVQRVLVSTVASWEDISRWYHTLCEARLAAVTPAMQSKCDELISGKANDMEKIMALFQFVSQQIRYTGITDEESAPGYEPHDVSQTFERRHGVCRDKAALLVAMLKLAGFKAYPVLFMAGTPKDQEVANIYFNHAIASVELADGTYILMDPTFETTTELFPGYLAGFPYLVAKPQGETLRTAPPVDAEDHLLDIQSCGTMDGEKFNFVTAVRFSGVYDQMYRAAFSEWTQEDIQNFFFSRLNRIAPGTTLEKVEIRPENIRDMSQVLQVTLTYNIPHMLNKSTGEKILTIPRSSMTLGLLDSIFTHTAPATRRFPLQALPRAVREKISLKLDAGFELTLPENFTLRSDGIFRVSGQSSFAGDTLTEEFFFAVDSTLIPPENYQQFKSAAAQAGSMWQSYPVIRQTIPYIADAANTEIIEHTRHYRITGPDSWDVDTRYIRRIINYAGVKEAANLTIAFIEGSETLEISATVTDSQGRKFTLSDKEINYMDAPETASAPRYMKRKIAVISFPGLDAGSTVDCRIIRHVTGQPFFHTELVTADDTPARLRQIIIEHPAQMQLQTNIPAVIRHSSTMGGKTIIRRYGINDSPRKPFEPGQLPYRFFVPTLRISGFTAPQLFDRINTAAQQKVRQADESVAILARQIAADAPEIDITGKEQLLQIHGAEKMRQFYIAYALEKYLYQHLREIDLPLNKMLLQEYSLPQTSLRDGYANSVDRAILLAAMLKAVDIDFEFVPVSSTPAIPAILDQVLDPAENIYTCLLLYLPQLEIFLNDSGLHGIPGVLRHCGNIMLRRTSNDTVSAGALSASGNLNGTHIVCDIALQADGSADITMNYTFSGNTAEEENERFARMTPALQRQYIERLATEIDTSARLTGYTFDPARRPQLTVKWHVGQLARKTGRFVTLQLPEYRKLENILRFNSTVRQAPYLFSKDQYIRLTYRITVPENYTIIRNIHSGTSTVSGVYWRRDYQRDGLTHCFDHLLRINTGMIDPEIFHRLPDLSGSINNNDSKNILFVTE